MDVILKEDIKGLGYAHDVVTVKPGYGRNFLIPQGKAILANEANVKTHNENIRQKAKKLEQLKLDAEALAGKIGELTLEIKTKVGEKGKIFGAITTLQISDALKAKGFDLERKRISFGQDIKTIGEYPVELDLHKEVKHNVVVQVIPEEA